MAAASIPREGLAPSSAKPAGARAGADGSQYWTSIATHAAPQPFFSWLTYGTSSWTSATASASGARAATFLRCDDDQDDDRGRQRDDDVGQLLIVERAAGEVVARLLGARSQ